MSKIDSMYTVVHFEVITNSCTIHARYHHDLPRVTNPLPPRASKGHIVGNYRKGQIIMCKLDRADPEITIVNSILGPYGRLWA